MKTQTQTPAELAQAEELRYEQARKKKTAERARVFFGALAAALLLAVFGYLYEAHIRPAMLPQAASKANPFTDSTTRRAYLYGRAVQAATDADSLRRLRIENENLRATNAYLTNSFEKSL